MQGINHENFEKEKIYSQTNIKKVPDSKDNNFMYLLTTYGDWVANPKIQSIPERD